MPRHDEMYVPAFKTRIEPCRDCGTACEVGWKRRNPVRCVDCAIAAQTQAIIGMKERTGPYYEKWSLAMLSFLQRELGAYRGEPGDVPDRFSST